MEEIRVSMFGAPEITQAGQPYDIGHRKSTALLVYLLATRQPHSRETLASLLWPDENASKSFANLRRTIYRINHLFDSPLLSASQTTVAIHPDTALWTDVHAFQSAVKDAQQKPIEDCIDELEAAAELIHTDFLAGFSLPDCPAFDEWQFFQAESLRQMYSALLTRLVSYYEEQRHWEKAILYQRKLLALDPLSEQANRVLMLLYAHSDQPTAALRQFDELKRRLALELEVEPDGETIELYETIKTRQIPALTDEGMHLPPNLFHAPPNTLPVNTITFSGRKQELTQLISLIVEPSGPRILTITGPGGIGKTRLSVETAQSVLPHFPDGVYYIPAATCTKLDQLIAGISEQVGIRYYTGGDTKAMLIKHLRKQNALLLIDNFDHLITETKFLSEILESAPHVKLLVTSRERLNLSGEQVFPLAGLAYQESADETAWNIEAVQLLVQLARLARPHIEITEQDLPHIRRICELVGGMPLALVLSAGWLELLSFEEISEEIARNIDFLHGKFHDLPERQHSVRAAFEYSWQKLSSNEQRVLMRMTVFTGGFTRQAALEVCSADLPALRMLIDKSLISVSGISRYDIHPVISLFASEKLAETGETEKIRAFHSQYYLKLLHQLEKDVKSHRQLEALQEIEINLGNIHTAWEYAYQNQMVALMARAVESLYLFFALRSRHLVGLQWLDEAYLKLQDCEEDVPALNRLLARKYWFEGLLLPHHSKTKKGLQSLLSYYRKQKDQSETAFCLLALGCYDLFAMRNGYKAVERLEQSLYIYQKLDDQFYISITLLWLSSAHMDATNLKNVVHFSQQSLELARQNGNILLEPFNLRNLAFACLCNGQYREAEFYNQEVLKLNLKVETQLGGPNALTYSGLLNFLRGNMEQARSLVQEALRLSYEMNFSSFIIQAQAVMSLIDSLTGNLQQSLLQAEENLSKKPSQFGTILTRWAAALSSCRLGRYESAEKHLREAIHLAEQVDYQAVVVWMLPTAAWIEYHKKRYGEAARLYRLGTVHSFALLGWMTHCDELVRLSNEIARQPEAANENPDIDLDRLAGACNWLSHPV
jgi:predicted ATPase/DNA-binding SARP family transcriptional activator